MPCQALGRIALRHQQCQQALHDDNAPKRKLYEHQSPEGVWYSVANRHVTKALRKAAISVQKQTGIPPELISARSMRLGFATALLCAGVDSAAIKLVGRWKSDAMFLYLHAQVLVVSGQFSQKMLDNGDYAFAPLAINGSADPLAFPKHVPPELTDIRQLFQAKP